MTVSNKNDISRTTTAPPVTTKKGVVAGTTTGRNERAVVEALGDQIAAEDGAEVSAEAGARPRILISETDGTTKTQPK